MSENKGIIGVIVIIAIILLILNSPSVNFLNAPRGLFSIFGLLPETQLKETYNTYWSNSMDAPICNQQQTGGCAKEEWSNDKFTWGGYVFTDNDNIYIKSQGGAGAQLNVRQNFYGQEVVFYYQVYNTRFSGGINFEADVPRNSEVVTIFKPHTLDNSKVDIIANGLFQKTVTVANPFYISLATSGQDAYAFIHYIGYKAQFSCDLSPDEVWVHEDFAQPFNIHDLTFSPTKFCQDTRPFTLRDIQQGETKITPDPTPDFNRGQTLTPPTNNLIGVNYATYYVSGVNNKCSVNEANILVGGKWVCSQVIKPVEVVVQCQSNSDCPVPLKNQCPNYFVGCQNQKCVYDDNILNSTACRNEVVTIVKQVQLLDYRAFVNVTSDNTFLFTEGTGTDTFNIGNAKFTSHTTSTCQIPSDVDFYSPSPSCFNAAINYDGNNYNVKDSQVLALSPYIKFVYYGGGQVKRNNEGNPVAQLTGNYYFTISRDALAVETGSSSEVLKDSDSNIVLNIINNLPDGKVTLKVSQKVKMTNQNLPEKVYDFDVKKGVNSVQIKRDASNYGTISTNVQLFYKVQNTLIPSNQFLFNYNVVDKLSGITPQPIVVYINSSTTPLVVSQPPAQTKTILYILLGVGAFFIISRFL